MNRKASLFLGGVALLLLASAAMLWAYGGSAYNRPEPSMDYAPQEIGIYDATYQDQTEHTCRECHGNSLADRMHHTPIVLRDGYCAVPGGCHEVGPPPDYEVVVIRDCVTAGCHSWADVGPRDELATPPNGWHHSHDMAESENCIACHDPNILDEVTPVRDHQTYPPTVVTPTPLSCDNCHWDQEVMDSLPGFDNDDIPDDDDLAGHPSTYEHTDAWGNWIGYHEYGKPISHNYDTHHKGEFGPVAQMCYKCHAQDPDNPALLDPPHTEPEHIRYCEICHGVASIHRIGPHVAEHNGWAPEGFHVGSPDPLDPDFNPDFHDSTDVRPLVYRIGVNQYTRDEQCLGCHAGELPDWEPDLPDDPAVIDSISPIAGSCGAIVTIRGEWFGQDHTADRAVVFRAVGDPDPCNYFPVPIHAWTDTLIEFELPCWEPGLTEGNYQVFVRTEDRNGIVNACDPGGIATYDYSNIVGFSIREHPTVLSVNPTSGPCGTVVTISGSGGFDNQRNFPPSSMDGYHGITHVVDLVASNGTYTALSLGNTPPFWTDTAIQVQLYNFFFDEVDDCGLPVDKRNFVQDDGTPVPAGPCAGHVCQPEALIERCDCFALGTFHIYVKAIYYGDDDGSNSLTCGDNIFQVEKSDPVLFELTNEPFINKINPRQIQRSYADGGGVHWNILRIYGANFGIAQGNGKIFIGTGAAYLADPFNPGQAVEQTYIALWSNTLIRFAVVLPPIADGMTLYVWVTKDGMVADPPRPLYIIPLEP